MKHITLYVTQFTYHNGCFSTELSDLKNVNPRTIESITLKNLRTRGTRRFTLDKIDKDGSGEDIYGWNYKFHDGLRLLIIND